MEWLLDRAEKRWANSTLKRAYSALSGISKISMGFVSSNRSNSPKNAATCSCREYGGKAPAENMVGRVPLIPLFLAGNSTPTIPHMFAKRKDACFPFGSADAAAVDGRRGSNVYEVNTWLWSFGRGKPRLGGLSIEQTEARLEAAAIDVRRKRAAKPKRVHKTAPA
mmetsp:Transcript_41084/g.85763  ORF Transcript_41084/g.85763 Transcript_41084/m.85763 type:complete len:166 (-) Transcript_41084:598-1095(-)